MKRIHFAWLDLVSQWRLFMAEVAHDSALRIQDDAREEVTRATGMAKATEVGLERARTEADLAARQVRRHSERRAMGLR